MEEDNERSLDVINNRTRLFNSVQFYSSIDDDSHRIPLFTPVLTGSNPKSEKQNGGREGEKCVCRGILQPSFSGPEERRLLETSHRPFGSKQVYYPNQIQDGNNTFHQELGRNRRLCREPRSAGRLLSYNDIACVKEVPSLRCQWRSPAVSLASFWDKVRPSGFHQNNGNSRGIPSYARTQTAPVFRRLATSSDHSFQSSGRLISNMANCYEIGSYSKPSEIGTDPNKRIHFCRDDVSHGTRNCASSTSQNRIPTGIYSTGFEQNKRISSFNAVTPGVSQCCSGSYQSGQTTYETTPVSFSRSVATDSRPTRSRNIFVKPVQVTSEMVVEPVPVHKRCAPSYPCSRPVPIYRFEHDRLGCSPRTNGTGCPWSLVRRRTEISYKQPRTEGCLSSINTVCSNNQWKNCTVSHRQHNSCLLYSQARGNTFPSVVSRNLETAPMVSVPSSSTARQTCSRSTQCSGGQFISSKQGFTSGMDSETGNCSLTVQSSRDSDGRSVCNQIKSSSTSLCISGTRTSSMGSRRSVSRLEPNVRVCISSIHSNTCNTQEDSAVAPLQNSSDSTTVASEVLVQRPTELPCGLTDSASSSGRSALSISGSSISHEPQDASSSRMAFIERSVREKEFSPKIASRIAKARRPSTQIVYNAKWNVFSNWCKSRSCNPEQPSMNNLASFFLHLFEEKNLAVSTIKGYRSMISNTLKFKGGESIGCNPFLSELIRSFELERPVSRNLTPKWDLSCVLWSLTKLPYEPLSEASIKFLTMKTVFLLAFATARRRSELHALSVEEGCLRFNKTDGSVSLLCQPGFLAKNQLPHVLPEPINVPSLANSCGNDDTDRVLCPVRSLKYYLKRVKPLRGSRKRLFLPIKGNKDISAASVSRWISDVIKLAYQDLSDTDLSFLQIRPHELRALSSSWAFLNNAPLEDVLRAAFWRSPTTFSSFYLRSFSAQASNLHSLGPLVASQRVIRK